MLISVLRITSQPLVILSIASYDGLLLKLYTFMFITIEVTVSSVK